jgi:hypothetical protein
MTLSCHAGGLLNECATIIGSFISLRGGEFSTGEMSKDSAAAQPFRLLEMMVKRSIHGHTVARKLKVSQSEVSKVANRERISPEFDAALQPELIELKKKLATNERAI